MKRMLPILLLAGCMVPLFACDARTAYEETETSEATPATTEEEIEGVGAESDIAPTTAEMRIDDVTLGNNVGADGSIPADAITDEFAPGAPVTIAMEVGDTPAGSAVRVVWLSEEDVQLHDETKTVQGEHYLNFQVDTDNWKLGDYRAEVWIGDERVNTQHFQIVERDEAG